MKNNKLTLSIHFIRGNRGSLVFKDEGEDGSCEAFRINRLVDALGFVACMKQLILSIALEAEQDCMYELWNGTGKLWVLFCHAEDGEVTIAVEDCQSSEMVFSWAGWEREFRDAVEGMIINMGRYAFFVV